MLNPSQLAEVVELCRKGDYDKVYDKHPLWIPTPEYRDAIRSLLLDREMFVRVRDLRGGFMAGLAGPEWTFWPSGTVYTIDYLSKYVDIVILKQGVFWVDNSRASERPSVYITRDQLRLLLEGQEVEIR